MRRQLSLPTPERINKLPAWARQYIHDLATRADPAGDLWELASLREQRDALVKKVSELQRELRKRTGRQKRKPHSG
jgi:hypothetical protein